MGGYQVMPHLRWHPFIGICWHDGVLVSIPPVPGKFPNVTFNVVNGLFLGVLPSNVKKKETLGPLGIPFIGRTSDAGFISPHVSIPPNNIVTPLTILLGGSESLLGASKVKVVCQNPAMAALAGAVGAGGFRSFLENAFGPEDYPMATCAIPYVPIGFNFGCNDPLFVPLDFVISPNNVLVGLTWADLVTLLVDLALRAVIDGLMKLGGKAAGKLWKKTGAKAWKKTGGTLVKKIKVNRAAKKLAKASHAGQDAFNKGLKNELDDTLKQGLRLRRAQVMARPRPQVNLGKTAREAGDEAYHKAVRENFPKKGALGQAWEVSDVNPGLEVLHLGGRLFPLGIDAVAVPSRNLIGAGLGLPPDASEADRTFITIGSDIMKKFKA